MRALRHFLLDLPLFRGGPNPPPHHHHGSCAVLASAVAEMDPSLWSSLPDDVLERILTWLPLGSILRFRAVSRKWNALLGSASFVSRHARVSAHRPCFLLSTVGAVACAYDPSLGHWLTLGKPAIPGVSVVAAGGSLLCLGNQVAECRALAVCNPAARTLRRLPPMLRVRLIHKVAVMEGDAREFWIVVTGEDGNATCRRRSFELLTELFDSAAGAWEVAAAPPRDAKFGLDPGVWCAGVFYCITELPYGLVSFDPRTKQWQELQTPMPDGISTPSLLNLRGKLAMAGRVTTAKAGITLWELREEKKEWIELSRLPNNLLTEFTTSMGGGPSRGYAPLVTAGVGRCAMITTHRSPRVLVFDAGTLSWSRLPADPLFPHNRDPHLLAFSFQPRFHALPPSP